MSPVDADRTLLAGPALPAAGPVVALDVDGVVNVDRPAAGLVEASVHVTAASAPANAFVRPVPAEGLDLVVRFDPTVGPWIAGLVARGVGVVWCSTWEHEANRLLAPLLGIADLPLVALGAHPARFGEVRAGDVGSWKARALEACVGDRPLVWVDDQLPWGWGEPVDADPLPARLAALLVPDAAPAGPVPPALGVRTDPTVGLTVADRARIDAWVDAHR